jgi:enoyl-CoA hydratase
VLSYLFQFVPYKVGLDLALTGREVDAAEALRLGLATSIAPNGGALDAARTLAQQIEAADAEAVALLRSFARSQAAIVDPPTAARGADLVAGLLASKAG